MFPQQPSAHGPYAKTPRLKNVLGGTRRGNTVRPCSEPIDRNDYGQREIVTRNVTSADENPTTIGNPLDNNDRRHWMTKETNEYEGDRFIECTGIGVAGSGVTKAIQHSQKGSGRRRGSSADAPRDRSPRRPHEGASSHGGQSMRRTNFAPFDEALTSTSCSKPSSVGGVVGGVSSLRGSPESAERRAELWPNCAEGRRYETLRTMATATKILRGKELDADTAGGDGPIAVLRVRGSPPKQPAVVRRLKMTLQQLNGL